MGGLLHLKYNCGGGAIRDYLPDAAVRTQGASFAQEIFPNVDAGAISNPAPLRVYNTVAYDPASLIYQINGLDAAKSYRVRLHFCETSATRAFNILLANTLVAPNFCPYQVAGALNKVCTFAYTIGGTVNLEIRLNAAIVSAAMAAFEIIEVGVPLVTAAFNPANLICEQFEIMRPDWEKVTTRADYQDKSVSFNTVNAVAPRRWQFVFSGLTRAEAAVLDDHYDESGISRDFGFTDRNGYTYDSGIYYESYQESQRGNRRDIQSRKIVLIRYP